LIIRVLRHQADAILGAMRAIAMAGGGESEADRVTIGAAAEIVFGLDGFDLDSVEPHQPPGLAAEMLADADARLAVRMLAVMSLVDGRLDPAKNALLGEYAAALGVEESYLGVLTEAAEGEVAAAAACMIRKNAESFPRLEATGIDADAVAPFLPYRDGREDPALEARYEALADLPDGSFGRAFHAHFKRNGFTFPGNPSGLAEGFTTPHDSGHVLSGYSTSQQGELCVSTFLGAVHPDHPMAAEVLPVLFSWHLGIRLNEIAGSFRGGFEPRRFWTAWERGSAMNTDIVAADWDFWGVVEVPLEELRDRYALPAVEPGLLA
jgi:hypothetical protein